MTNETRHYLMAIRQRLERLYKEHPEDARLREHISDEVSWIDEQLHPSHRPAGAVK
jgi:hypothetical protein